MFNRRINEIDTNISLLIAKLKTLQNPDGGFKSFFCTDKESGIWSTAETIHTVSKVKDENDIAWLQSACEYLARSQNADGGWPFRPNGKSITDITAWSCLALSHFGYQQHIERGINFILNSRNNEGSEKDDAWGLTTYEADRVYSTWMATYCLSRLLKTNPNDYPSDMVAEMKKAITQAKSWVLRVKNEDGGWGPMHNSTSNYTSTAFALLTLFMLGEDPAKFKSSYDFLRSGITHGLWPAEDEIVVTKEGYELNQQWFTSAICFRTMIFFAELDLASIEEIDDIFNNLLELISADGGVSIMHECPSNLVWTTPHMIDACNKYKTFVRSKQREYSKFLENKYEQAIRLKKQVIEDSLQGEFPYPISQVFSKFQHELDYHRKFQLLLQLYEVTIKYVAITGLSGSLTCKETDLGINALLTENLKRPSLGDWGQLAELLLNKSEGFTKLLQPLTNQDILRPRAGYLDNTVDKANLNQVISRILNLRNSSIGHGALQTQYEYKLLIEKEENILYSFFDRMSFLASNNSFLVLASQYDEFGEGDKYKIRIFKGLHIHDSDIETSNRLSEGQKETMVRYIYFQNTSNNIIVNLYPFLSFMFCEECKQEQFFFYNGIKGNNKIKYLSYGCGHNTEKDNFVHFQKRFMASGINW